MIACFSVFPCDSFRYEHAAMKTYSQLVGDKKALVYHTWSNHEVTIIRDIASVRINIFNLKQKEIEMKTNGTYSTRVMRFLYLITLLSLLFSFTRTEAQMRDPAGKLIPAGARPSMAVTGVHSSKIGRVSQIKPFQFGDVFVAVKNGLVLHFSSSGTLVDSLNNQLVGEYVAGMAFDKAGNLYLADFSASAVSKFDKYGNLIGTFGSGYSGEPESIVFNDSGDAFVGAVDGDNNVREFDSTGHLIAQYAPATEDRGTDWIDLARDQHTLYYTSEGLRIMRFDVSTNTQLSDFAVLPSGSTAYALRVLPNGEVIVAAWQAIYRLDPNGNVIQTYTVTGNSNWFAVNLDPDGKSFWSGDLNTGDVYKFDISTGNVLQHFSTGTGNCFGLAVFGELTSASYAGMNVIFNQIDASNFPKIDCYLSVEDSLGNPINSLNGSNFTVYENNHVESPISVTPIGGQHSSVSVALVIDRSGSMDGQPLQDAKSASSAFVDGLKIGDRAAVISFNDQVTVDQTFTSDTTALNTAINNLVAGGATAIYDAVYTALASLSNESLQRKAVVLLTDGGDNSSHYSLADAIHYANQLGLPVYAIGLGLTRGSTDEQNLISLADSTGGKYYYAPTSSDLVNLYNSIALEIQNQYRISYTTNNPAFDGTVRQVKIVTQYLSASDTSTRNYMAPSASNWLIRISAVMDSLGDINNYAGVNFNASDSLDSYDAPKPPPPLTNYLQLYFPHPEWGGILGPLYSRDIRHARSLVRDTVNWNFEVNTDRVNRNVTIQVLPDSLVPANYLVVLTDVDGGNKVIINKTKAYTYNSGGGGVRHFILTVGNLFSQTNVAAGWNLLSIPLFEHSDSVAQVLGNVISGSFYAYDYSADAGYNLADTLSPGYGFWLGLTSNSSISEEGTQPSDTFVVHLKKFWNIVGDPGLDPRYKYSLMFKRGTYLEPLDSAISMNWVQGAFYAFSSSAGSYILSDTLEPWSGYWFASLVDSIDVVFMPSSIVPSIALHKALFAIGKVNSGSTGWKVPLFASSSSGARDLLASFGVNAKSSDGIDLKYDLPEPPSPPTLGGASQVKVYFPHPEWRFLLGPDFAQDIRDTAIGSAGKAWPMRVYSSTADNITLRWNLSEVPLGQYEITLVDSFADKAINMVADSSYSYAAANGEKRAFGIIVKKILTSAKNQEPLPTAFVLSQNYPNPFNPTTMISFDIPKRSQVRLVVYDILGREVKTLVDEMKSPGRYTVNFDASALPSGVYLYRITAGSFVETKKLVLVK